MKCLNPKCGKEMYIEDNAAICDHCGTAMTMEAYVELYAAVGNSVRNQLEATFGATGNERMENLENRVLSIEQMLDRIGVDQLRYSAFSEPVTTVLDNTSTDYRDRVDRMVAAAYAGYWATPTGVKWDAACIAKFAIANLDAIDAAIKEKEKK